MKKNLLTNLFLLFSDLGVLSFSYLLGYIIRAIILPKIFPQLSFPLPFSVFYHRFYFLFIYLLIFFFNELYNKRFDLAEELQRLWKGLLLGTIIIIFIAYLTQIYSFSRIVVLLAFIFSLIFLPLSRWLIKLFLIKIGLFTKKIKIVGDNGSINELKEEIIRQKYLGYQLVEREETPDILIITNNNFREKLITFSSEVFIPADLNLLQTQNVEIEKIGRFLFLKPKYNLLKPFNLFLKTIVEYIFSLIIFILFLPLFFLISLLIKLTSPGPIFHKQKRFGLKGKVFTIYKFRTMKIEARKYQEIFKEKCFDEWQKKLKIPGSESLVTPIGKFLRRFSLDELPQLINVLKGEMALVGPRPYLLEEKELIANYLPIISKVKPGLTGLWQISGRGNLTLKDRLMLDEYYVKNWSLWLDFSILLLTFKAILKYENPY
ncbi:MAG: sugar transferase [candidate division WOR-3 bacterium]|nr:sugar transferase [candidate division WOR-3 bacterium]MCX7836718.1 sugar transferase [candidate division WOR-3 bacterium]MDW8113445.1 sugar transferase [candidate division WOR-3 bacterium]